MENNKKSFGQIVSNFSMPILLLLLILVFSILSDRFFTPEEISQVSVVAPNAVLNIIRNYEVIEKKTIETPDELRGIIRCNNPKCITNNEPMSTIFHVNKKNGIVRCHYCDKEQDIRKVELA